MIEELSLEERVLRSIMEPSRPSGVKSPQEETPETPKPTDVPSDTQLGPDMWVEFYSRLFGMVTAKILSVEVDTVWLTNHSVLRGTDEPCRIPASWIMGVYRDDRKSA